MTDSKEVILKAMGLRLRRFRCENGYSRKEIAEFLEISERTYASYERGEHDVPMDVLYKLAPKYRITMAKMLYYEEEKTTL